MRMSDSKLKYVFDYICCFSNRDWFFDLVFRWVRLFERSRFVLLFPARVIYCPCVGWCSLILVFILEHRNIGKTLIQGVFDKTFAQMQLFDSKCLKTCIRNWGKNWMNECVCILCVCLSSISIVDQHLMYLIIWNVGVCVFACDQIYKIELAVCAALLLDIWKQTHYSIHIFIQRIIFSIRQMPNRTITGIT